MSPARRPDGRGMRALAIIPARGGSKRVPRKNIIDFRGRPIIAYTIDACRDSGCFQRIVVSTEDAEIAEVSQRCGAEIIWRPAEMATDSAGLVDVCLDAVDQEAKAGRDYDLFGCLYAPAPLRTAQDIRDTFALVADGGADFSMAVCEYDHPPHQALKLEAGGVIRPMFPDLVTRFYSDVGPLVAGNGSTYVCDIAAFRAQRSFYGTPLKGHVMPRIRSVDIDLPDDLLYALWLAGR